MQVIADLCIIPISSGTSLSRYVAACVKTLQSAGLKTHLHSYGTNVEGEWDEVFAALKKCHELVHSMGAARVHTNIKLGTRTDRAQSMEDKVTSVDKLLTP